MRGTLDESPVTRGNPLLSARMGRDLLLILLGASLLEFVVMAWQLSRTASIGVDLHLYQGYVARFLAGGSLYQPWQLAGPYEIHAAILGGPVYEHVSPSLYPPLIVPLIGPFLVLPEFLWWAIPLGIIGYVLWRLRPGLWAWVAIAALCVYPRTLSMVLLGNPAIWCVAAIALALLWRWPAIFVLLKPSLLPFALVGIRARSWWVGASLLVFASLPFVHLWNDWITAILNSRGGGLAYSFAEAPTLLIPLVAWVGRTRQRRAFAGQSRRSV